MKTSFNVYDPLVQQALQQQGSQYVVPQQMAPGAPVNTFQPLTPEEQAMGAMMQEQQAMGDMDAAAAGYTHQGAAAPPPGSRPISLDWQPPEPTPPLARVQSPQAEPGPAQPQRSAQAAARPSQNRQRQDAALSGLTGAMDERKGVAGDVAGIRADTAQQRADLTDRSAVDDMMAQQELADAADAHQQATAKIQQEQRADADFIRNYVPSDRRTTGQRAMGALAVALSGIGDAFTAQGGGQGRAMDRTLGIINTSIDRDIDLQQRMLENKKTALAAKNSELGQMRERYGDNVESIKLARAMKLDQYGKELESIVARGSSQEASAAAKETQAAIEQQKQQLLFEVYGARYQQELKARTLGAAQLKQRLALEGSALDNELKRKKLENGGEDVSADERKVARSLGAVRPAVTRLEKVLQGGDIPYAGVRSGTQGVPDLFIPNDNIQYRNDVMAVAGQALRDDSGAVLGPAELSDKLERMGVFSGSEAMRAQGLKDLKYEYDSRLNRGQAPKETPEQAARSRLRPGAAR